MQEFDAILVTYSSITKGRCLEGKIYNDRYQRFGNGTLVKTSPVASFEGAVAVTESGTRYLICEE
ncbi:hypothetical protein NOX27_24745 [Enterobacter kobei]|uniref:hypothetical protein n=1 Tax=Enterobacter kobei TaxID=208224 RepID=UPI00210CC9AA|nr:hypothetical protein [Enterobacter kobei]MCQ4359513.1 hypothetical protein [Enterobacter kobei]HDC4671402.1 hypothetical protein [Enterobacter kobei]